MGGFRIHKPSSNKILSDILSIGIANLLIGLNGIVVIPLITKTLGANNYGLYVQFTVTISLIMSFATLGLPYAAVRFLSGEKDKNNVRDGIYSSIFLILIVSIAISLLLMLFAQSIAAFLFENSLILVKLIALIIPIECLSYSLQNVFRIFQEIKKYTIYNIVKTYSEVAVISIIILKGYGIIEIALSILAIRLLFFLIISIIIISMIGIELPKFRKTREYLKFSLPTIPSNVALWITNSSDRYIIGMLLGVTYIGYYNPGYNLGALISMLMTPINFVLVSIVAKHYEAGEMDAIRKIFKFSTKYYLMIAIPSSFGLSILSKSILTILSTPEIANNGYLITPFIAFSNLIFGFGGVSLYFSYYLCKKTHIDMVMWFIVALVNLGLNLLLVSWIGLIGAAIATMAAFLAGILFGGYFSFKYFSFDIEWNSIVKILISSIVMSLGVSILHPITVVELVFSIVIGFAIYSITLILIKGITKEELAFIRSYL